jgi:hypothetical protein
MKTGKMKQEIDNKARIAGDAKRVLVFFKIVDLFPKNVDPFQKNVDYF